MEKTWNGKSSSRIGDTNLATPSLKGESVALDLGVRFTPESAKGLQVELGAVGKLGDCHGVTGQIKALYVF